MKDIMGNALLDYWTGVHTEELYTETNISFREVLPLPYLFRSYDEMPELEKIALSQCRGKILDVGCGAGSHALYLQKKGLEVMAIDRSVGAISVCRKRGIKNVRQVSLLDLQSEAFDTILLLMNGTGIFETVNRVAVYLKHLRTLLNPGGQVIIDSTDLIYMYERDKKGAVMVPADRYYGELTFIVEYGADRSEPFPWLYMDIELMGRMARQNGFEMAVIAEGEHFDYLAKLQMF